jgi:hypothetical protein
MLKRAFCILGTETGKETQVEYECVNILMWVHEGSTDHSVNFTGDKATEQSYSGKEIQSRSSTKVASCDECATNPSFLRDRVTRTPS